MVEKGLYSYVADRKLDIQTLEYYRLNKLFMRLIGQWPFSPVWQQRLGIAMIFCGIGNLYVLEVIHMIDSRKDVDQLIECFAPFMINTGSIVKLGTLFFGAKAVRELLSRMHDDWNTRLGEAEMQILREYANNSKFLTSRYMVYMYFSWISYIFMPTVPMVLNMMQPLNESRPRQLPSHAEYFIDDPTEHYLPLFLHQSIGTFSTITIVIACDTMYVTYVQHACGIFAILNYHLEHLTDEEIYEESFFVTKKNDHIFAKIVKCVEEHKRAIKFAEFIETTYHISNLLQMIINILTISVTGVQTVVNLDQMEMVMRHGAIIVAELMHLLFNSLPGQAIHDHSSQVFRSIYNCNWYSISKNSRNLLKLMMIRSKTPCQLTAGKMYVMDLGRFTAVIRSSVSFFTLLSSMRSRRN